MDLPPEGPALPPSSPAGPPPSIARIDGLAIASLIVGILAVLSSVLCVGLLLGPVAVLLGSGALLRSRSKSPARDRGASIGLAAAGLVLGIAGVAISGWILHGALNYCHPGYPCEG